MMRQSRKTLVAADSSEIAIVTSALIGRSQKFTSRSETHALLIKQSHEGHRNGVKRVTPHMAQPSVQRFRAGGVSERQVVAIAHDEILSYVKGGNVPEEYANEDVQE